MQITTFQSNDAHMMESTLFSFFMPVIYAILQCSASCGQGYRQRLISCSEVHVENDNYEYGHQSLSNCPGTPPESYMPCNLGPCPLLQEWRVGIWGLVSESGLPKWDIAIYRYIKGRSMSILNA